MVSALLVLLLFALHGVGLERQSLWLDEAATWSLSHTPSDAWQTDYAGTDRYKRGYLWLVAVVRQCAGNSPAVLRGISVAFFWVGMIAGTLLWWRRLGQGTAMVWGLIFGISAYWWQYSQEAQPYSLGFAMAMLSLLCHEFRYDARFSVGKARFFCAAMVLTISLGVACNFYVILAWPVILACDLFRFRRTEVYRTVGVHLGVLCFMGLLLATGTIPLGQQRCIPTPRVTSAAEFAGLAHMLVVGLSWGPTATELRTASSPVVAVREYWSWFLVSGMALTFAAWGFVVTRAWREGIPEALLGLGTLAALAYLCWRNDYAIAPRHLFLVTPMFLGWIAVVFRRRPLCVLPLLACMAVSTANYLFVPKYGRENWRDALDVLSARVRGEEKVVFFTNSSPVIFDYYLGEPGRRDLRLKMVSLNNEGTGSAMPDYLIEARPWELLNRSSPEKLRRLKSRMVPFYAVEGITIWRKSELRARGAF